MHEIRTVLNVTSSAKAKRKVQGCVCILKDMPKSNA
jgi:hypothetical protein